MESLQLRDLEWMNEWIKKKLSLRFSIHKKIAHFWNIIQIICLDLRIIFLGQMYFGVWFLEWMCVILEATKTYRKLKSLLISKITIEYCREFNGVYGILNVLTAFNYSSVHWLKFHRFYATFSSCDQCEYHHQSNF